MIDPIEQFYATHWPSNPGEPELFYDKEWQLVKSVRESVETYCVSANKQGKDYTAGGVAVGFFLRPQLFFPRKYVEEVERGRSARNPFPHTRKIVTTSVKAEHLVNLWGEIARWLTTGSRPVRDPESGRIAGRLPFIWSKDNPHGELVLNSQEVRFAWEVEKTRLNCLNYMTAQVSLTGEGMSGHHAAYTLIIGDEASAIDDAVKSGASGWARRELWIGNARPCSNFYRKNIEAGDLKIKRRAA